MISVARRYGVGKSGYTKRAAGYRTDRRQFRNVQAPSPRRSPHAGHLDTSLPPGRGRGSTWFSNHSKSAVRTVV